MKLTKMQKLPSVQEQAGIRDRAHRFIRSLGPDNSRSYGLKAGKNWQAHKLVDDPAHHERHMDYHERKANEAMSNGNPKLAMQHVDWAQGHRQILKFLDNPRHTLYDRSDTPDAAKLHRNP